MSIIRECFDEIEKVLPKKFEPFPTYETLLR